SATKQWQVFHRDGTAAAMVGGDAWITGAAQATEWQGNGSGLTQWDATHVSSGYWGSWVGGVEDMRIAGMVSEGVWQWVGITGNRVAAFGGTPLPTTQTVGWRRDNTLRQLQLTLPQLLWQTSRPTVNQLTLKTWLNTAGLKTSDTQSLWLNVPSVGMGRLDPSVPLLVAGNAIMSGTMNVGMIRLDPQPSNAQLRIGSGTWGSGVWVNGSSRVSGDMGVASVTANQLVMGSWVMTNPAFGSVGIGRVFPNQKLAVSGNGMVRGDVGAGSLTVTTLNTPIAQVATWNGMRIRDRVTLSGVTVNQFDSPSSLGGFSLNQTGDVTANTWRVSTVRSAGYDVDSHGMANLNELMATTLKGPSNTMVWAGNPLSVTMNEVTVSSITIKGVPWDPSGLITANTLAVNELRLGSQS
ncbi:hypothetical protein EBZ35_08870, partial [bacterium]|nr:hypothetical protein [bacterium]